MSACVANEVYVKVVLRNLKDRLRVFNLVLRHAIMARFALSGSLKGLRAPNLLLTPAIYIDPRRVQWAASVAVKPDRGNLLFCPGDWDLAKRPMREVEVQDPKYTTCRQLLAECRRPEETDEFHMIMDALAERGEYRGCRNEDDVILHMRERGRFYLAIASRGYKTQRQLGRSAYTGEVQCAIDREGNLIKINAGNHRFAAARQLGVAAIPVHICLVHDAHRSKLEAAGGMSALVAFIDEVERRYAPGA